MFYLKRNLPMWERVLRLCVAGAMALVVYSIVVGPTARIALLATAVIMACTAAVGICPACAMLGRKPLQK